MDQSDSNHRDGFGGTVHIFRGDDLPPTDRTATGAAERIDLGASTADLCRDATGAVPVRAHMLHFNREGTHAVISFLQSGHVVVLDAESRTPTACLQMSAGEGGGRQANSAYPAPDGSYIVVANQDGKLLERIDADFRTNTFTHNPAATLDLTRGATPAGLPLEGEPFRPDNAPVCPVVDEASRYTWVTLQGGGLLVLDARRNPMFILAEYDRESVKENGCGSAQIGDNMFLTSGAVGETATVGGLPLPHSHRFDVYRFPLSGYEEMEGPNLPVPDLIFAATGERDASGLVAIPGGRYLWVADRHADVIEVIEVATGKGVNTVILAGPLSEHPAPSMLDVSPSGAFVFAALRGPTPIFGDPHNAHGTTPGLGIVRVEDGGRDGELVAIVPFSNEYMMREMADPHAVRVRRLP